MTGESKLIATTRRSISRLTCVVALWGWLCIILSVDASIARIAPVLPDGNGNVTALVDASTALASAEYEYGPFGEQLRATGPMAETNPFQFSTKYTDGASGLVYYGYRFYNPQLGLWLNPDPLGEEGGLNLYQAFFNAPTDYVDVDGLQNVPMNPVVRPAPRIVVRPRQYTRSYSYNSQGKLFEQTLTRSQRDHRDQFYMQQWMRNMANPTPPGQAVIRQGWTPEMAPKPAVSSFTFCSFSGQNSIPNLTFYARNGIGATGKIGEDALRALAGTRKPISKLPWAGDC